jgi:hypothetical protein
VIKYHQMERGESCARLDYLTSKDVTEVLQVGNQFLQDILRNGLVKPPHVPRQNGKYLWGPQEIFRAFLSLRLTEEYKMKYGDRNVRSRYEQVRRDLLSAERVRGRELLESEEWKEVAIRAEERGLNLLDLQKVQFNRGLSTEN